MIKKTDGGVTAAKGFEAIGIAAGIKKGKKDMALIYSRIPCEVAGTFTTNVVKAAPVKWDQSVVYGGGSVHAVVVNSGVANACTGEEGLGYCKQTAEKAAELFWHQGRIIESQGFTAGFARRFRSIRSAGIETMRRDGSWPGGSHAGSREVDRDDGYANETAPLALIAWRVAFAHRRYAALWHDPSEYVHDA